MYTINMLIVRICQIESLTYVYLVFKDDTTIIVIIF